MAEVAVPGTLFAEILRLILRRREASVCHAVQRNSQEKCALIAANPIHPPFGSWQAGPGRISGKEI